MKTRLKACDSWHPDTPERIVTQKAGRDRQGNVLHKRGCLECQRIKVMEHRHRVASDRPYGIIRLDWTAPEFMT